MPPRLPRQTAARIMPYHPKETQTNHACLSRSRLGFYRSGLHDPNTGASMGVQ
ncbi:hypothetical protein LptCag_2626 [Leptospirillum ferriphilum]|uniref:Uncharacterized protein n=1 Tax=Leptospirillum ferriphilum TaxID=178606 RepID=A0A094WHM3_9BACT|nr:hypothetical protein LptCag_2626 [Leptospirillum ferriphilum]